VILYLSLSLPSSGEEWNEKGDGLGMIYHKFQLIKTKLTWRFATKYTKSNKTHRSKTQILYPFSLSTTLSLFGYRMVKNEMGRGIGFEEEEKNAREFLLEFD
jgi:hypothetical protein